jgi:penicillin amidase
MEKRVVFLVVAVCAWTACSTSHSPTDVKPSDDGWDPSQLPVADIHVFRDPQGIPHIYAETDEDLFFGYGYQIASDRLFQLDMFRRRSQGRLCEVLGSDYVIEDQQAKIFNWQHWGRLGAEKMKAEQPVRYRLLQAWAAGINRRLEELSAGTVPRPLGLESADFDYIPEPYTAEDAVIVQKMAQFGLDLTLEFEVFNTFAERFFPEAMAAVQLFKPIAPIYTVPPDERPQGNTELMTAQTPVLQCPDIRPPRAEGLRALRNLRALGSNNWAVDGRHTANGKPLFAGDPHIGFGFSGLMYAIHLNSKDAGGTFNVAGFAFVGAPGIAMGQTDKVLWSPTSAFPDVMDMWEVTVGDGTVSIAGNTVPTVTRTETIHFRDGGSKEVEVVDVPGYGVLMPASQVGSPIPIAQDNREVLVGWTGFSVRTANYFLELNRVASITEFEEAVLRMPEMSYNFVAADASGITYRVGVEVPARHAIAEGREPWKTMDGDDPLSFWPDERLSPDQLPHSRALERGWLATANNDPFGFTDDGYPGNDPWYYGAFFAPGWRAARIEERLSEMAVGGDLTIEDMQALQMDTHSNLADELIPMLETAWAGAGADPSLEPLMSLLSGWDREMRRESTGALAFHAYAHLLTKVVLEDDMSLLFGLIMESQPVYLLKVVSLALQGKYPNGEVILQDGNQALQMNALAATAAFLSERYGALDSGFTLADARFANFDGAFGLGIDLGMVPTDGGETTVNVAAGSFFEQGNVAEKWLADWGPMVRLTGHFTESGPELYTNFPIGNVADRTSEHYDDALTDWTDGHYHKFLFHRAEIEAAAVQNIRISTQ